LWPRLLKLIYWSCYQILTAVLGRSQDRDQRGDIHSVLEITPELENLATRCRIIIQHRGYDNENICGQNLPE